MNDKHKMAGPDFLSAIVLILLGVAMYSAASNMRVFRTLIVSPGLFPMILGGVFVLCGLVMLGISLRHGGFGKGLRLLSPANLAEVSRSPRFRRGGTVFLLILAYVCLFGNSILELLNFHFTVQGAIIPVNTGFILLTFAFLFATFKYLKAMSGVAAFLLSLTVAVLVFYVFNKGFGIPVP